MNAVEIEEAISALAQEKFDAEEFPYAWSASGLFRIDALFDLFHTRRTG
jgi:hypothetical protein